MMNGTRIQTRLHCGEALTLAGLAKEMDNLAAQIEAWAAQQQPAQQPTAEPPPLPPT